MAIAAGVTLHVLAAIIWVGGMFFAIQVLRLASGAMEPPDRVALWGRTFARFFPWVWVAVVVMPLSGYWLIHDIYGGMSDLPISIDIMQGLGWVMVLVFLHLWFAPYARFKRALAAGDVPEAGKHLNTIRLLVTTNLYIGLINAVIGASARFWG